MSIPKRVALLLAILIVLIGVASYAQYRGQGEVPIMTFPDSAFQYEIVTTPEAQERGLGGRKEIPDNYGMLFVFPTKDRYGFWMKDMLTSIDIVWLNDDGTIMKIDANVDPASYPKAYYPPEAVQYVLETRAGYAALHEWKIGTHIALPSPYVPK